MSRLEQIDRVQLGKHLRQHRKAKGFKISNLTENGLSQSTISNIERGLVTVEIDRIERYCEKLDIDVDVMVEKLRNIDSERELIKAKLRSIESIMVHSITGAKKGLEMLGNMDIPKNDPLFATIQYLRGKCFTRKHSWYKAKTALLQSIQCVDLISTLKMTNLKAASYYELSRVCYYTSEFVQALTHVELGLKAFEPEGERRYIRYNLLIMKVFCLEMLERIGEALQTLTDMWEYINDIDDMRLIVNMYDKRTSLLISLKLYNEATKYALEGIEKARRNELNDRAFELWVALSAIYQKLNQYNEAILAINTALSIQDSIKDKSLLVIAYTQLGSIHLNNTNAKEAVRYLKIALQHSNSKKDSLRLIDTYTTLGDGLLQFSQFEDALASYQKALEFSRLHKIQSQECIITAKVCYCIEQMDNAEKYHNYLFNQYKSLVKLMRATEGGART
ncbi:helix-turn-helix domain-containing protein [Laceyella putida]|uniref:Helix-turn-helix domain-containing protein n=1 Tax=Laceyella putida TaxID=110101 RepID=A0ABW2RNQ9_9BACL